ncbi:MAG: aminoacyl-tRNA hydrolase [Planctomycetaceae bacterium]|nr:aminoacyl-tRNA hydrolase [Planctomycetaceae bacterium]
MKLVTGLGNPGRKYQQTRHNVGFMVLTELSRRWNGSPSSLKFDAEIREASFQGERLILCAPQTYMNLSGQSVAPLARFYKIELEDILIICDDMNLPLGKLRLRASGSSGGQNGLKSIFQRLGSETVPRLRFGIGRPPERMDPAAYVLQNFLPAEQDLVDRTIQRAADAVENWCQEGIVAAMNRVNSD